MVTYGLCIMDEDVAIFGNLIKGHLYEMEYTDKQFHAGGAYVWILNEKGKWEEFLRRRFIVIHDMDSVELLRLVYE